MVSGTLNNSNFYSFKSYWIFGILVYFQSFKLRNRIRNLKLWLKFQSFKLPYFEISKFSNLQNVLEV